MSLILKMKRSPSPSFFRSKRTSLVFLARSQLRWRWPWWWWSWCWLWRKVFPSSSFEAHLVGPLGKISMAIMAMMIKMTMTMVMTMMVLLTKRLSIILLLKVEAHLVGNLGKIMMTMSRRRIFLIRGWWRRWWGWRWWCWASPSSSLKSWSAPGR